MMIHPLDILILSFVNPLGAAISLCVIVYVEYLLFGNIVFGANMKRTAKRHKRRISLYIKKRTSRKAMAKYARAVAPVVMGIQETIRLKPMLIVKHQK